jgi:hypothetical protein
MPKTAPPWKASGQLLTNFRKCGLFACPEAPNPASRDEMAPRGRKMQKICFVHADQRKVAQCESGDVNSPFIDPRRPTVGNELF